MKATIQGNKKIFFGFALVTMVALAGCIICLALYSESRQRIDECEREIVQLQKDNAVMQNQLERERIEHEQQVSLLSNEVVSSIVEEEEENARKVPAGLPFDGRAVIEEEPATAEEQEFPAVLFSVKEETLIVSSGDGVVEGVYEDATYGYKVVIDHGNGYQSLYFYNAKPKVKEGTEVNRQTLLFEVSRNQEEFLYAILLEEEYLNPMLLMEISG